MLREMYCTLRIRSIDAIRFIKKLKINTMVGIRLKKISITRIFVIKILISLCHHSRAPKTLLTITNYNYVHFTMCGKFDTRIMRRIVARLCNAGLSASCRLFELGLRGIWTRTLRAALPIVESRILLGILRTGRTAKKLCTSRYTARRGCLVVCTKGGVQAISNLRIKN